MNLNRRHKAILFTTLVLTGSALLAGAELKYALGMFMLGTALAWAVGSDTATRIWTALKSTSNIAYRWIRLPLVIAFAGCVLSAVLALTHANTVAAIAAMCIVGTVIAPLTALPRQGWLTHIILIPAAILSFFGGMVGMFLVYPPATAFAEQAGEAAATAGIALIVGIFWLSKGSRLIRRGISPETTPAPLPTERSETKKKVLLQYTSLVIGFVILTLLLSTLTFGASSDWSYGPSPKNTVQNNSDSGSQPPPAPAFRFMGGAGVLLLFAAWPYKSWKTILSREPNADEKLLRRHRRVTSVLGMLFTLAMSVAVTFGVQNGTDRHLVDRISEGVEAIKATSFKIGAIKGRDLKTTADYIQAYSEIEPLLNDYESELQRCTDNYEAAKALDESRGPANVQRFYRGHKSGMETDAEALEFFREMGQLIRREVETINQMATLPEAQQVQFWKAEYKPLLAEEDGLREKLSAFQTRLQGTRHP